MPSHLPPPSLNPLTLQQALALQDPPRPQPFLCFRTCTQTQLPAYVPTWVHTDTVCVCVCHTPSHTTTAASTQHCDLPLPRGLAVCARVCVCVSVTMGDGVLAEGNGGCHTRESGTVVCSSVPYKRELVLLQTLFTQSLMTRALVK